MHAGGLLGCAGAGWGQGCASADAGESSGAGMIYIEAGSQAFVPSINHSLSTDCPGRGHNLGQGMYSVSSPCWQEQSPSLTSPRCISITLSSLPRMVLSPSHLQNSVYPPSPSSHVISFSSKTYCQRYSKVQNIGLPLV